MPINYAAWNTDGGEWTAATTPSERLNALATYGVLAPSPDNCQPWRMRIDDDHLRLGVDRDRTLPVSDPTGRQMPLSLGCVAATMEFASRSFGSELEVLWTEDRDWPCVIRLASSTESLGETYRAAIRNRHSDRRPFERSIAQESVDALSASACAGSWLRALTEDDHIELFADRVVAATQEFASDKAFRRELAEWLRPNDTAAPDGMPGTVMGFRPLQTVVMKRLLPLVNTGKPMANQARIQCLSSGAVLLIGVPPGGGDDAGYFAVGRTAATAAIEATRLGLASSWIAAAAESPTISEQVRAEFDLPGDLVISIRVGVGLEPPMGPTPRRSVSAVVKPSADLEGARP